MNKSILFLGYDRSQTQLLSCLDKVGCRVDHAKEALGAPREYDQYDLMICFGYRHIIQKSFLEEFEGDILNLHIAYLPWNRGVYPNFWAFADNTPHGVTIHLIDEGIDTGPILYQKYVNFDAETTFRQSHDRLIAEIEELFVCNIHEIVAQQYDPKPQRGIGSYHAMSDLPQFPGGWEADVDDVMEWLDNQAITMADDAFTAIERYAEKRAGEDARLIEFLRLAFRQAPRETAQIIDRITDGRGGVLELFAKLRSMD